MDDQGNLKLLSYQESEKQSLNFIRVHLKNLTLLATEILLLKLTWFHSGVNIFFEPDGCFLKSVRVRRLKLRPDIGTGPQRASMRRLSPHTETRRPPWAGRCTRGAGHHRCHQSWRWSARIWSQAWWRAVKMSGGGENVRTKQSQGLNDESSVLV